MSRSVLRLVAGAVLIAAIPAVSQAQGGSCSVNTTSAPPWSCGTPVMITPQFQVPTLARLTVTEPSDFPDPPAGWAAYLTGTPAAASVVTQAPFTVRTNATHDVTLNYVSFGGGWSNSDVQWGVIAAPGACLVGDATTPLAASNDIVAGGTATADTDRLLCLRLNYPIGNLADARFAYGVRTLTLEVTITSP